MRIDRRQLLAAGGACLASCGATAGVPTPRAEPPLDVLLAAHAGASPERPGAGANHYPMAAEALEALGREDAIEDAWVAGAAGYASAAPLAAGDGAPVLGDFASFDAWRARFRAELAREPKSAVLARWAPRLAPGIAAATFHGVIRTGHAARALRVRDTPARRDELAVGLAYWAARYLELPVTARDARAGRSLRATLEDLDHPWLDDVEDVEFSAVLERLTAAPLAPPADLALAGAPPRTELELLVREAAAAFLEMLVLERHRVWLLHAVTGPAAVDLLLADVDEAGARALVAHAHQAVVALLAAYGAPYTAGAHVRAKPGAWTDLVDRAVATRSVHTIKLTEALTRFAPTDDRLFRSVAAQWLEWT